MIIFYLNSLLFFNYEKSSLFENLGIIGHATKESGKGSVFVGTLSVMIIVVVGLSVYFIFRNRKI